MAELLTIDHTFSREHVLEILSLGKGISIRKLNSGLKNFDDLYEELQEQEVKLYYNTETKGFVRFALNVKLLIKTKDACFYETKRVYHPHNRKRRKEFRQRQKWSISETRKRSETPIQAVRRGFLEELGRWDLINQGMFEQDQPFEQISERPSRVYKGLISRNATTCFTLELDEKILPHGKLVKDHGVHIYIKWFENP